MTLYCGIDLHSNNHVICVIDDKDKRLLEVKLDNYSELTIRALSKYKIKIESDCRRIHLQLVLARRCADGRWFSGRAGEYREGGSVQRIKTHQ